MFGWDDKDTKTVFRTLMVAAIFISVALLGSLLIAFYLSFEPSSFVPLTMGFLLLYYPFGLKVAYLTSLNILATYPVITSSTLLLTGILSASIVLFIIVLWRYSFFRYLMDVKGFEKYGDVKKLMHLLLNKGTRRQKLRIVLNLAPISFVLLFMLAAFLSSVAMIFNSVYPILFPIIILAGILITVNSISWKNFVVGFAAKQRALK